MQELNNKSSKDEVIDLIEMFGILKKRRKLIYCIVFVFTAVSIAYSLVAPKFYKSKAVLMPISSSGGGLSSMMGQMGGLATLLGAGTGMQTPSQQIMALLKTRALAETVIKDTNLLPILYDDDVPILNGAGDGAIMEEASEMILSYVSFDDSKELGTVTITSEFKDPKISAQVAQSYVDNLQSFLSNNALTVAKRNRIFIEGQLELNKRELLAAGKELNEFYKNERVSNIESSIDVAILNAKTAGDNKDLESLQKQKAEVDQRINELRILRDVPQQVYLQYLNLKKTLLTQVYSLLTQQYEMAKIQEAKEDLSFQLIDPPQIPEKRSKPKRKLIVMISFVASIFIAVFISFLIEYVQKFRTELRSRG